MFKEYFKNISNNNFLEFSVTSSNALKRIINTPHLIKEMLLNVNMDTNLKKKSEIYDFLDKIVIYSDDKAGVHARVSLFHKGYGNRIHYHRWNYTSYILKGGYEQSIYGFFKSGFDLSNIDLNKPILKEQLIKGNIYSLEHTAIHSISVQPDTLSICIRGKPFISNFQVYDPIMRTCWLQYGSKYEAIEEKLAKRIPAHLLSERIQYIITKIL